MASVWLLALGMHRPLSGQFPGLQFFLGLSTPQIVSATLNPLGFLWRERWMGIGGRVWCFY